MTPDEAERYALAGAASLDMTVAHERNWRNEIDLERLEMGNSCGCIVGQLKGRYLTGIWELHDQFPDVFPPVDDRKAWIRLGFNADLDDDEENWTTAATEYQVLTDAWKRLLS